MDATPDIPGPDRLVKPPAARAPTGACDCHAHVFARPGSHYLNPLRGYTPPEASLNDFRAMHRVLGIDRAVIVQPSVYGTDNRCSRQAVEALGDAGRGVAVIDLDTPDDELARLHEAGFRGSRFNVLSGGGVDLTQLEAVAARLAELGWHLQTFIDGAALAELAPRLAALPVEVVVDHLGHPDPELDIDQPGFRALLGLLRDGQAWVKISGAYRVDSGPAPWPAADRFAEALIAAAPDRLVWGSDWPHPALSGPMPNDGDLFDRLLAWTPDEDLRRRILVDNPARLYDFP